MVFLSSGFLVGDASHVKREEGGATYPENTEDGVPKFQPSPITHLYWRNISLLLKQKLTIKAFDETLL